MGRSDALSIPEHITRLTTIFTTKILKKSINLHFFVEFCNNSKELFAHVKNF